MSLEHTGAFRWAQEQVQDHTVAGHYERHVQKGRAMLTEYRWLVKVRLFGHVEYWHCDARVDTVEQVAADRDVRSLEDFANLGGRPRKDEKPPLTNARTHTEMVQ